MSLTYASLLLLQQYFLLARLACHAKCSLMMSGVTCCMSCRQCWQ
jgi:hypothetical protein